MDKPWSRTAIRLLEIVVLIGGITWAFCQSGPELADLSSTQTHVPPTETAVTAIAKTAAFSRRAVPPVMGLRVLYRLTDVGRTGDQDGAEVALNNRGEVALTTDSGKAFLWRAGHRMPLASLLKEAAITVGGLNDRGEVVGGDSVTQSGSVTMTTGNALLWRSSKAVSLGSLPSLSDATAVAINEHEQVVGNSCSGSLLEFQDTMTGVTHAFLWERGRMTDLGDGMAAALNSSAQVVGALSFSHAEGNALTTASHAALWERDKWHDLGTLPGWTFSAAAAINSSGAIVGYCYNGIEPEPSEAFLWQAGHMRDLGPGQALGINPEGQAVGRSGGRAALWWHGGFCDLNTCLRGGQGWTLTSAVGVNDRGQIIGIGTYHGESHAFLLTPIRPLRLSRLTRRDIVPQTPQMHLIAAPTGSHKIILYWKGVTGATGYNVYRGLASMSRTARINQNPVRTCDPGVAGGWATIDRGLKNGVTYVYTVTALSGQGREIARSNPSQAAPDPDAPPWDSRDAAKIAAKLWANAQSLELPMDDSGPVLPPQPSDFTAPDGIIYKDPGVHTPLSPYRYLAHPAVAYDAVDLGDLGGPSVVPRGISGLGRVVGNAQPRPVPGETRPALPFLWQNGTMQALPIPPSESPYGFALAINASGMVCGDGNTLGRHRAALVWLAGAVCVLPSLPGGFQWAAYGINNTGQVAGDSSDAQGRSHMVWWDEAGRLHDMGFGRLMGVNAAGQVVGTRSGPYGQADHAVRSESGVLHDLGTLGGPFSQGMAINSHGDVVGWSNIAHGSTRGFLYSEGKLINLGLPPAADSSHANALNDSDVIVGSAQTPTGSQALIWRNNTLANLNDLTTLPPGVTLTDATAINTQGQICAVGRRGKTSRAYLLTPRQ